MRVVLLAFTLMAGCCPPSMRRVESRLDSVEAKVDHVLANQAQLQVDIDELVQASRRQGTGEITLYFPWNGAKLRRGSAQHRRLVRFLDRLAMESHGRTIRLVAIGSAPEWKDPEWNQSLSLRRAWAPRETVARHLVHVPYEWVQRYGIGAAEVPADAGGRTWRHVRIIAVYDEGQLPELPRRPASAAP